MNKIIKGILFTLTLVIFACSSSKQVLNDPNKQTELRTAESNSSAAKETAHAHDNMRKAENTEMAFDKIEKALQLTSRQKTQMTEIRNWFKGEKLSIIKGAQGKKEMVKSAIAKLALARNAKVKEILNPKQFETYMGFQQKRDAHKNEAKGNKEQMKEKIEARKNEMYQRLNLSTKQIAAFEAINKKYKNEFYQVRFGKDIENRKEKFIALQKRKDTELQSVLSKDQFQKYKDAAAERPNMGGKGMQGQRPNKPNANTGTRPGKGNGQMRPNQGNGQVRPEAPSTIPATVLDQLELRSDQRTKINTIISQFQLKIREAAKQNVGNQAGNANALKDILMQRRNAIKDVLSARQFLKFQQLMRDLRSGRRTQG